MKEANIIDMEISPRLVNRIKTPGTLLKEARETKKLSQTEIAEQVCLSLQRVKELEKDDYSNMAALIYVRGYLRAYARCVGVSPDEVIAALNASALEEEFERMKAQEEKPVEHRAVPVIARSTRMISPKVVRWITIVILLTLVIFLGIWWQGKKRVISQIHAVTSQSEESLPLSSTAPLSSGEIPVVNNDFSGSHH